jgi:hypothetical protein
MDSFRDRELLGWTREILEVEVSPKEYRYET